MVTAVFLATTTGIAAHLGDRLPENQTQTSAVAVANTHDDDHGWQ
ncbi:hypothetical protein [Streptomyces sp. NBC_00557]|nr:hypothetical protein [Streptomyces sp. NBC_00557]WUC40276.1 hypothetical protein OG956_39655 [Streptomyces sp. NBC_00557]